MAEVIEYFYSTRSSFTYLGHAEIVRLAAQHGRRLVHRPVFLSVVVPGTGGIPFQDRHPARLAQAWEDLQRWAELRGIPIQPQDPKHHYGTLELPSGLVAAAQRDVAVGQPALDALALEILAALWRDDRDIADPDVLTELCEAAGIDAAEELLDSALTPEVQSEIQANSEEAVARGIIGAPTYVIDGAAFFGQDRLDFVARALQAAGRRGEA